MNDEPPLSNHPTRTNPGPSPNPDAWEEAYLRFETPQQEIGKFVRRAYECGAANWPRDAHILDLFSGRGNGLRALHQLGFSNLEGIDLSVKLVGQYDGPAKMHVGDCRALPFSDGLFDIAIVQGGLHHLPEWPGDLEKTLREVRRVLKAGGKFVVVEPWLTPFLRGVHVLCRTPIRRVWGKLDALAVMIEYERKTYEQWLSQSRAIRELLQEYFEAEMLRCAWGKIQFVGERRS